MDPAASSSGTGSLTACLLHANKPSLSLAGRSAQRHPRFFFGAALAASAPPLPSLLPPPAISLLQPRRCCLTHHNTRCSPCALLQPLPSLPSPPSPSPPPPSPLPALPPPLPLSHTSQARGGPLPATAPAVAESKPGSIPGLTAWAALPSPPALELHNAETKRVATS